MKERAMKRGREDKDEGGEEGTRMRVCNREGG